jgi:hypothetical protein
MDSNETLKSLLRRLDELKTGDRIYLMILKSLWGRYEGVSVAALDCDADRIGVAVDDQVKFVKWAVKENIITSETSFAKALENLLVHLSGIPRETIEVIVQDHAAGESQLRGREEGPEALIPSDENVRFRVNQLFYSSFLNHAKSLTARFDGTGEFALMKASFTDQKDRAFDFLPIRMSKRFYSSMMLLLKVASGIAVYLTPKKDHLADKIKFLLSPKFVDPEVTRSHHWNTLRGQFRLPLHRAVDVVVTVHGKGELEPEELELSFEYPEGYPEMIRW